MEAIADLAHMHVQIKGTANEGDRDVFMLLSYCVA